MKIFITGASSGIGREVVKILVAQGHEVKGLARREQELSSLQQELGDKFSFVVADVSSNEDRQKTAAAFSKDGFVPDVCILNAGSYTKDVESKFEFSKFQENLKTNLGGAMFWVELFLPRFLEKNSGTFLAVSSTSAYRPGYTSVGYPASKAALSMAFRGLRLNFIKSGVKFTTLHFGPIRSRLWSGSKSFLIPSAENAARHLVKTLSRPAGSYFFPFLSTTLFRLSLMLPDKVFSLASSFLKKTSK